MSKKITKIDEFNFKAFLEQVEKLADEAIQTNNQPIRKFRTLTGKLEPDAAVFVLKSLHEYGRIDNMQKFDHFANALEGDIATFSKSEYETKVDQLRSEVYGKSKKTAPPATLAMLGAEPVFSYKDGEY